jgi:hypothetical protein
MFDRHPLSRHPSREQARSLLPRTHHPLLQKRYCRSAQSDHPRQIPRRADHGYGADKVSGDNSNLYPVEFLNSLNVSGLPLAHIPLKPGCPLMLLRNIDPANGLCNGTRMILLDVRTRVLRCRILGGDHAGKRSSSLGSPWSLQRRVFLSVSSVVNFPFVLLLL